VLLRFVAALDWRLRLLHVTTDAPLGNEGRVTRKEKALDRN